MYQCMHLHETNQRRPILHLFGQYEKYWVLPRETKSQLCCGWFRGARD